MSLISDEVTRFNKCINNLKDHQYSPSLSIEVIDSFKNLFRKYIQINNWTGVFELIDRVEEIQLDLTSRAEIYRMIGDLFYKIEKKLLAIEYYKKAVRISNETNLEAQESYENLINSFVELWHYRMLNDRIRNEAYSKAIENRFKSLKKNESFKILDIGTGTGLLSAICYEHACKYNLLDNINIFACEQNEFFYEISLKFLDSVDANSISLIKKHSNKLNRNKDFDKSTVNLIVTEIFDDGLLGEGCLDTFYHAFIVNKLVENNKNKQLSIPYSARIYICAIECEYLNQANRFEVKLNNNSNIIATCTDNSWKFDRIYSDLYEPYTTENLNNIKVKYLTKPLLIDELDIRFNDFNFLKKYCELNETLTITKRLKVINNGRLDAYAIWFDLYLDDEIILTNSPIKEDNTNKMYSTCWNQAIYNCSNIQNVLDGQYLDVDVKFRKDCLLVLPKDASSTQKESIDLDRNEISLLNNNDYQSVYVKWFDGALSNHLNSNKDGKIEIGFLFEKYNVLLFKIIFEYISKVKTESGITINLVIFINDDLDQEKLNFIKEKNIKQIKIHKISSDNDEYDDKNSSTNKKEYFLDFLIFEPIDGRFFSFKRNLFTDLLNIRNISSNKDLKIFPEKIRLSGLFFECIELLNESELGSESNLCLESKRGNKLKEILSEFLVNHHYLINLNNLKDFKKLSSKLEIFEFDLNNLECSLEKSIEVGFDNNGVLHGFIYWYEICNENLQYPDKALTHNQFEAVIFHKNKILVSHNDTLEFKFLFKNDLFHVKLA